MQYPWASKKWALLLPLVLKRQGEEAVTETAHTEGGWRGGEGHIMGAETEQTGAMPTPVLTLQESQSQ